MLDGDDDAGPPTGHDRAVAVALRLHCSVTPSASRGYPASSVLARPRLVSESWPLWLLFGLFPLWWALGLTPVLWITATVLFALYLGTRRDLRLPTGFLPWLLFLLWMAVSLTQIRQPDRMIAFFYRGANYTAATLLFIYIYNQSKDRLPTAVIVRILALYWCYVAVGGLIAVAQPHLHFSTPMSYVLPHSLTDSRALSYLFHPRAAQLSRFLGFLVGRPVMPFSFTNGWGANYALAFPFLVLSWRYGGQTWRWVTRGIAAASVFPVVASLDRGLWLSLGAGLLYAAVRLALAGRGKSLMLFVSGVLALGAILVVTPLGGLIVDRAQHGHSDKGRAELYSQAVDITGQSPVFGYGAPQPSIEGPDEPSVGTHGQFWLVLVSQGVPGVVLFLSWYFYMLVRTGMRRDHLGLWCHIVVVISVVQLPFYQQLPAQLSITMVAAALVLRGVPRPLPRAVAPERDLVPAASPA